jgi:hypothetical protein
VNDPLIESGRQKTRYSRSCADMAVDDLRTGGHEESIVTGPEPSGPHTPHPPKVVNAQSEVKWIAYTCGVEKEQNKDANPKVHPARCFHVLVITLGTKRLGHRTDRASQPIPYVLPIA